MPKSGCRRRWAPAPPRSAARSPHWKPGSTASSFCDAPSSSTTSSPNMILSLPRPSATSRTCVAHCCWPCLACPAWRSRSSPSPPPSTSVRLSKPHATGSAQTVCRSSRRLPTRCRRSHHSTPESWHCRRFAPLIDNCVWSLLSVSKAMRGPWPALRELPLQVTLQVNPLPPPTERTKNDDDHAQLQYKALLPL